MSDSITLPAAADFALTQTQNSSLFQLIREDASRWVAPGGFTDLKLVGRKEILGCYYRHLSFQATFWYRMGFWARSKGVRGTSRSVQHMLHKRYGFEIVPGMPVGGGFYLAHSVGQVISAQSIGRNFSIIAASTIGIRNEVEFPIIGDNVFVGAGARILGGITIGNNVVIGANSVVITDIPDNATVVGIPGKVVKIRAETNGL